MGANCPPLAGYKVQTVECGRRQADSFLPELHDVSSYIDAYLAALAKPNLGFPLVVYLYFVMRREERAHLVEFGEDYRQYMERVPRTNFVAGVVRLLRCRRLGAYE